MNTSALKTALLDHFKGRVTAFVRKLDSMRQELQAEFKVLVDTYGSEAVEAELARLDPDYPHDALRATPQVPVQPKASKEPKTPITAQKTERKRRRRRRVRNALSFTNLKPYVLTAVETFGNEEFTIHEVQKALKKNGVKFDPAHPSLILSKYLDGITTRKGTSENYGKRKVNIFKATGKVSLASRPPISC